MKEVKANELRLGSLVRSDEGWLAKIEELKTEKWEDSDDVYGFSVKQKEVSECRTHDKVYAAELTDDLLIRVFGFEKDEESNLIYTTEAGETICVDKVFRKQYGGLAYVVVMYNSVLNEKRVQYAHELQNLVQCIWGVELECNFDENDK